MEIPFYKYHGTGNDFVLIDNREKLLENPDKQLVSRLCDRHFGIGADGIILLEKSADYDFYMRYYNADGQEGSMCGNGGRCVVAFANTLGIIKNQSIFKAVDGIHEARINNTIVSLKMTDVEDVKIYENHFFLNTGSPHHVCMVKGLNSYPVLDKGKQIRYDTPYYETGTNVNFVEQLTPNHFKVRTYERGVEDETLSCGTGVTAVAIAMFEGNKTNLSNIILETLGGRLEVRFKKTKNKFTNIFLKGAATFVFKGKIQV